MSLHQEPEIVRLTREVQTSARKARDWTRNRDYAIRLLREQGASLREIAAAAGLSHTAIAKILERS